MAHASGDTCKWWHMQVVTHGPTCIFFAKNTVYFQFEYFLLWINYSFLLKNPDFTKNAKKKIVKFKLRSNGRSEKSWKIPKLPVLRQKPVKVAKISQNSQFCGLPNSCKIGYTAWTVKLLLSSHKPITLCTYWSVYFQVCPLMPYN